MVSGSCSYLISGVMRDNHLSAVSQLARFLYSQCRGTRA